MARKLYAQAPDGTVVTRRTDRDYSHAVLAANERGGEWGSVSWHGTKVLATKSRDRWAPRFPAGCIAVVPVTDSPLAVGDDGRLHPRTVDA